MNPKGNPKEYFPRLYGFKIYGKKGSKYYKKDKAYSPNKNIEGGKNDRSCDLDVMNKLKVLKI